MRFPSSATYRNALRWSEQELREQWAAGARLVAPDNYYDGVSCMVDGCRGLSFVKFISPEGPRVVCLLHFEAISTTPKATAATP